KHPYKAIPKAKWMEAAMRNLAERQETLRDDVNQLKAQVGQIIEKLESMQSLKSTPTILPQTRLNSKAKHSFHPIPPQVEDFQSARMRLDTLEGVKQFNFDAVGLCLVPNIVIPPKFELPVFDKYKGTTCPKSHLTMYCRKMAPQAHDDALLIHFFQESLTGIALEWYLGLKRERVQTWKSLVESFLDQHKYNMDMIPTRS
ncbi:hypothetical protein CR513_43588, partial [Mucuna pruriens]